MPRESRFQSHVIKRLERDFPGCFVIKIPTEYQQGLPDLLFLIGNRWGFLEVKRSLTAPYEPNQEYYLDMLNQMSYAAMICPENEEEIFGELQQTFEPGR